MTKTVEVLKTRLKNEAELTRDEIIRKGGRAIVVIHKPPRFLRHLKLFRPYYSVMAEVKTQQWSNKK